MHDSKDIGGIKSVMDGGKDRQAPLLFLSYSDDTLSPYTASTREVS